MAKSKLSRAEVLHIAELSGLPLTEKELSKFQDQLSEVLEFVESLNKLDTQKVEPTSQVTGLKNVVRADKAGTCLTPKEALSGAAETRAGYFVAGRVIGKG